MLTLNKMNFFLRIILIIFLTTSKANAENVTNWLKSEIRLTTNEKYVDILEMEEHLKLEHILPPPIFLL